MSPEERTINDEQQQQQQQQVSSTNSNTRMDGISATTSSTETSSSSSSSSSPQLSSTSSSSACPYAAALNWNATTSDDVDDCSISTTITTSTTGTGSSIHNCSNTTATKRMIQACPAFQKGHCPFASCTNEQEIRKMFLQIPSSHYTTTTTTTNTTTTGGSISNTTGTTNHDDTDIATTTTATTAATTKHHPTATAAVVETRSATTPFLQVLQEFHSVAGTIAKTTITSTSTTTTIPSQLLPNKCPVFHTGTTTTNSAGGHNNIHNHNHNDTTTTTTINKFTHVIMDGYSLSEIMARLAKEFEEEEEEEEEATTEDFATTVASASASTITTPTITTTTGNDTVHSVEAMAPSIERTIPNDKSDEHPQQQEPPLPTPQQSPSPSSSSSTGVVLLSATMKRGTAASHVAAENVYFVRNFIRGQIDPILFAELTCQLYYVYATLEYYLLPQPPQPFTSSSVSSANVHVQQFLSFHTQLQRTESLKDDLDYWFGTKKAEQIIQQQPSRSSNQFLSPATNDYLERIEYCATHDPYLLLAHSYTRYLGDLSGGKILARVARKAMQLSNTGEGLAFYDFTATIGNTKQFKDEYRTALDNLYPPLTNEQVQLLVAEANIAFALNMRIFEELDVQANIPNATVCPLMEAIQPYLITPGTVNSEINSGNESHNKKAIPKECPFANMSQIAAGFSHGDNHSTAKTTTTNTDSMSTATNIPNKHGGGRCPWPFIVFHDPKQALYDWQTWMVLGLLSCWLYHQFFVAVVAVV